MRVADPAQIGEVTCPYCEGEGTYKFHRDYPEKGIRDTIIRTPCPYCIGERVLRVYEVREP